MVCVCGIGEGESGSGCSAYQDIYMSVCLHVAAVCLSYPYHLVSTIFPYYTPPHSYTELGTQGQTSITVRIYVQTMAAVVIVYTQ